MNKSIKKKLAVLDPKFRNEIKHLLDHMNDCIGILYDAATRDEKTGLYNNKFFENIIEMELEKAQRGKQKLSLVITDIDFFKKVNDTYGHVKADDLLKQLAKVMMNTVRKSDIVARFGGEEFVIVLPGTSIIKAKKFCTRLRNVIHKDKILKKYGITVSGGITEYKNRDTRKKMMARADKALYSAKESGRDKFVSN